MLLMLLPASKSLVPASSLSLVGGELQALLMQLYTDHSATKATAAAATMPMALQSAARTTAGSSLPGGATVVVLPFMERSSVTAKREGVVVYMVESGGEGFCIGVGGCGWVRVRVRVCRCWGAGGGRVVWIESVSSSFKTAALADG